MEKTNAILALVILAAVTFGAGLATQASIGSLHMEDDPSDGTTLDLQSLEALAQAVEEAKDEAPHCPYEDQSGGWGGQSGECRFVCPPPSGTFTLYVSADDADATVSGSANCGSHDTHCSGQANCKSTTHYAVEADGHCEGDSDEFYDSGFYLNCWANAEDDPDPGDRWCIVERPFPVCIDRGPLGWLDSDLRVAAHVCASIGCELDADGTLVAGTANPGPSGHLAAVGGSVFGALCDLEGCWFVTPTVTFDEPSGRAHITM